jgi:hypothetical protein
MLSWQADKPSSVLGRRTPNNSNVVPASEDRSLERHSVYERRGITRSQLSEGG